MEIFLASILIAAFVSAYSVGLNLAVAGVTCISSRLYGFIVLVAAFVGGVIAAFKFQFLSLYFIIALVSNIVVAIMGGYGGLQALNKSENWLATGNLIIIIRATLGTNFSYSTLTDANFTKAKLKNTNFLGASLTRTCFKLAEKIQFARVDKTYLENLKVQEWLVARIGKDKNFDRQDLRGVNLQGVILTDASFIGADLSNANLQDADLSRAKLVQAQLDGTDFTGAILTGAYIEDWNITNSTNFTGVRCEYVYMRLPTKDNPDPHRKPDDRKEVFGNREFGDFIKPIFDTLDLYHSQGVDPRAIAISFKRLAENHPEAELRIVGMEVKGEDKFLLRAKTAATADKSELGAEYFSIYNELKALAQEVKALVEGKDIKISRLENMIITALERPSFYVQNYNNQGDTIMSETFNNNNQGANIANFANQVKDNARQQANQYNMGEKQNLAQAASEIQQLLHQLELNNPTSTDTDRAIVAAKAADAIKNNPTLKARVIGALKSGGKEAR